MRVFGVYTGKSSLFSCFLPCISVVFGLFYLLFPHIIDIHFPFHVGGDLSLISCCLPVLENFEFYDRMWWKNVGEEKRWMRNWNGNVVVPESQGCKFL